MTVLAAILVIGFSVSSAHAGLKLKLSTSSGASTEIADGDMDGIVNFFNIGGFGNFGMTTTTGASKPLLGSSDHPAMHLNSFSITSLGADTLTILFTDTDFTLASLDRMNSLIGGVTNAMLDWSVFIDYGNNEYGQTELIASGSHGPGAFSSSQNYLLNQLGPFSITMLVNVTHTAAGQYTSFDLHGEVPEPASIALLSLGMLLLGCFKFKNDCRTPFSPI